MHHLPLYGHSGVLQFGASAVPAVRRYRSGGRSDGQAEQGRLLHCSFDNFEDETADANAELEDILEGMQVALGHGGVDLELHALGLEVFDAAHGGFEGTGHTAESVVAGGVGTVDGNGTALEAGFLYLA